MYELIYFLIEVAILTSLIDVGNSIFFLKVYFKWCFCF